AIALFAQAAHFILTAVELRVARVVTVEAAGVDLDRAGAPAGAGALDRFARRLVHREEIVAADLDGGQSEPRRATGDVAAADRILMRGAFTILVVLED